MREMKKIKIKIKNQSRGRGGQEEGRYIPLRYHREIRREIDQGGKVLLWCVPFQFQGAQRTVGTFTTLLTTRVPTTPTTRRGAARQN